MYTKIMFFVFKEYFSVCIFNRGHPQKRGNHENSRHQPQHHSQHDRQNRWAACRVAAPGTLIVASNPRSGPVSIESHFDEAVSAVGVIEEVRAGELEQTDAYILPNLQKRAG